MDRAERPRPVIIPPKANFNILLEALVEEGNTVRACAITDFFVNGRGRYRNTLALPVAGRVFAVQVEARPMRTTSAEERFAETVIANIPADTWDACVAAFATDTEAGRRTALSILANYYRDLATIQEDANLSNNHV